MYPSSLPRPRLLVLLASAILASTPAFAATKSWNVPTVIDGFWDVAGNWVTTGVPGAGDDVVLGQTDSSNRLVTLDTNTATLGSLLIDATGSGLMTLGQTANSFSAGNETLGATASTGKGIYNQSGGTNLLGGSLFLGINAGSTGTYSLSGTGLLTVPVGNNESIGQFGTGNFYQSGGTNTLGGSFILGNNAGSAGSYDLSGNGLLIVSGFENIGNSSTGSFTQSGGTHSVSGSLRLGSNSGGFGSYSLGGTGLLTLGTSESIGNSGTGSFYQSGGTHRVTTLLNLGSNAGSVGSYSLGGTGLLTVGSNEQIGGFGTGSFVQTGGTNSLANNLVLATSTGGVGSYSLTSGLLTANGFEYVGNFGTGSFVQTGGTNNIGGNHALYLAVSTGSTGNYGLMDGVLNVTGSEFIGFAGPGTFAQRGGTNLVSAGVTIGSSISIPGIYTLQAGTLTASSMLVSNTASVLTQTGGSLGTTLTNRGTYSYGAGVFDGRLINQGTVVLNASFTISNGIENDTSLTVQTGQTVTTNGLGLDNLGTVLMSGGTVAGAGGVTNESSGLVVGRGTINNGVINNGAIQSFGGTLTLSGAVTNGATSSIAAGGGSSVLISSGLATNVGLINLSGGTFDNNGHAMSNAGIISGFGTFNFGGIGLTNNGSMAFSAGSTIINGAVTNSSGHSIAVALSPATFTGAVVNFGSFVAVGTTVNFPGGYTEHGTFQLDPSTANFNGLTVATDGAMAIEAGNAIVMTGGSALVNAGNFSNAGSLAANSIINTGTLTQTGTFSMSGTFTNAGTAILGGSQTLYTIPGIAIAAGSITLTQNGSRLLKTNSLTITGGAGGGKLDLADNDLFLESSSPATDYTALKSLLGTGRSGGGTANLWAGNGITSSLATHSGPELLGLALISGPDFLTRNGAGATFDGQTVDANSILIKYTYVGDMNLDGKVTIDDLLALDSGYLFGKLPTYANGDLNYDGAINAADFGLFNYAFRNQGAPLSAGGISPIDAGSFGDPNTSVLTAFSEPVPEPASLAFLALATGAALLRCRRRSVRLK